MARISMAYAWFAIALSGGPENAFHCDGGGSCGDHARAVCAGGGLAGVPGWGVLGGALLLTAQALAPPPAPVPRPPEDLRALPAFLAEPNAPLVLDLRGRGLRAIPVAVLEDRRLHEIDLRDNRLTTLPDALKSNPALRVIRIGGNPIPPDEVRRFGLALLANSSRMVLTD